MFQPHKTHFCGRNQKKFLCILARTHSGARHLPEKARKAHIFPGLQKPLISIGTLCDNNCIAVFDEKRVTIYDKTTRQIVMQCHRDPKTKLYIINMTAPMRKMTEQHIPDTLRANHLYEKKSKQELTLFYHAACFSPKKRTLWTQSKEMPLHPGQDSQWSSSTSTYQEHKQPSRETSDRNTKARNQPDFNRRAPS